MPTELKTAAYLQNSEPWELNANAVCWESGGPGSQNELYRVSHLSQYNSEVLSKK